MDDRWGGDEPILGRLLSPGAAPLRAKLIAAPKTPFPKLFGRALGAALRAPLLALGLGGAILLSRAGWAVSLLLVFQALMGESTIPLAGALGLGFTAGLFATVVELAIWAGGVPLIAERIRGERARPWHQVFGRGLEAAFVTMLGIGVFRVLAWMLFQLAAVGFLFALLLLVVASPVFLLLAVPLALLFVAGDLLARILAWIAIARAGAFEEDFLEALVSGLRQFFARPMAHLLTWWAANLAVSLAGGGVAMMVAAGLGAMPALSAALLTLVSSLVMGTILLGVMAIYTALSLDAVPPRARASTQLT